MCVSRFKIARQAEGDARSGSRTARSTSIIGTHRLLSKDVKFKDLGLVIIDEEQRFGVEHKETAQAAAGDGGRADA